jgi:FtsH-binding integral membrane protein
MTTKLIFIGLTIHLIIPLAGLICFIWLTRKMKKENVVNPPTLALFFVFATYGGLLLVLLTTLFLGWSGLASLGTLYLLVGAPVFMGSIAYDQRKNRDNSKYHDWTYRAGLYYLVVPFFGFIILLLGSFNK